MIRCDGTIRAKDLPERVRNNSHRSDDDRSSNLAADRAPEEWLPLAGIEGRYVARVLAHTGGNKQAASRVLGVDRKTLDRMIKRHRIDFDRRTKSFPLA